MWHSCTGTTPQSVENGRRWNFLIKMISRKNEIKKQVIGRDPDLEKSGRILDYVIAWNRDGITIRQTRDMSEKY